MGIKQIKNPDNIISSALIIKQIEDFDSISLDEIKDTKLLNRYDSKFWLNYNQLLNTLKEIQDFYFILNPDGTKLQLYKTVYFDTVNDNFYLDHHNGKAGRIKIRKRQYVHSGLSFLEIKSKSNKGKSNKQRLVIETFSDNFTLPEKEFIFQQTSCKTEDLISKLINSFYRITLVSKNFDERCTIDLNITFDIDMNQIFFDKLVIIELKKNSLHNKSVIAESLKRQKINPEGFSKYCIGRAMSDSNLKKNNFKPKILELEKKFRPIIKKSTDSNQNHSNSNVN